MKGIAHLVLRIAMEICFDGSDKDKLFYVFLFYFGFHSRGKVFSWKITKKKKKPFHNQNLKMSTLYNFIKKIL